MIPIVTDRLILRQWRDSDLEPFAAMNACSEVMRYFPSTKTVEQSAAQLNNFVDSINANGWGFWATESASSGEFMGFVGLNIPENPLPFSPCVEIGWRLAREYWGQGYATEGARAAISFAFESTDIQEIVSMTPVLNLPSMRVMQKIGLQDSGTNFEYPTIQKDHELCEHVLYKITRQEWLAKSTSATNL